MAIIKDFDPRFFQVAPEDQRPPQFLSGGEQCELHNLSRSGLLRFSLPEIRIATRTILGGSEQARDAQLHTVLIEPDLRRVQLVWLMTLECHGREHLIERTLIHNEGDRSWLVVPAPAR